MQLGEGSSAAACAIMAVIVMTNHVSACRYDQIPISSDVKYQGNLTWLRLNQCVSFLGQHWHTSSPHNGTLLKETPHPPGRCSLEFAELKRRNACAWGVAKVCTGRQCRAGMPAHVQNSKGYEHTHSEIHHLNDKENLE